MSLQPFIPFPNSAEVVCQGTLASQQVILSNGVHKSSAFTGTDLEDIGDAFCTWLTGTLLALLADDLAFQSVKVTDLTTQFSPVSVRSLGLPATGGVTAVPVPNNVAAVISYATTQRGRPFRGRNYVPGAPDSALQTATEFTATFVSNLDAAYSDLGTALSNLGFEHSVLSRQENSVRRTTGVATRINAYIGRTPIGTQRRRVIGHGS